MSEIKSVDSAYRASKATERRLAESQKIRATRPGQVPAIVEPHAEPGTLPKLPRNKYLIARNYPAKKLRAAIMKDAGLPETGPLVQLVLRKTGIEIDYERDLGSIDDEFKDEADGFLYVTVALPPSKKAVPYIQGLLSSGNPPPTSANGANANGASTAASNNPVASPHGERVPEGATIASCTFLNPRGGGKLLPELVPTCNGRVPGALYVACLLDVTAVGLVVPLLAAYSRALGAGPQFTGILQATYGLCQLIGANVLGGLSDTRGRKTMLLVSCFGGVVGYSCLALAVSPAASSLALLLASRVPIGLLKQSLTVARAVVVDATPLQGRMRPMSRLGGCVGVGFVLGPAFGGVLSKKAGLHFPPLLAAVLFSLSSLVVSTFLPESAPLPLALKEAKVLLRELEKAWAEAIAIRTMATTTTTTSSSDLDAPTSLLIDKTGTVVRATSANECATAASAASSKARKPASTTGPLPLQTASDLSLSVLNKRLPNYQAPRTASVVMLIVKYAWGEASPNKSAAASSSKPTPPVAADGSGAVEWDAVRNAVVEAYAEWKVSQGMLHTDAATALMAAMGGSSAAAEKADDGSDSSSGGGGGSGLVEVGRSAARLWQSKSMPKVRRLLMARALVEISVMILHAAFADYTRIKFGWDQKRTGYGMAVSGALSVLVDVFLLPMLHSRKVLSEVTAALVGGVLVASGLLSLALSLSVRGFFVGLVLLSLGTSLFKSSLSTIVMGLTRRDEAGTISGAMDAMEAVCRVAAPLIGGFLLQHVSVEGPPAAGCLLAAAGIVAVYVVAPHEGKIKRE